MSTLRVHALLSEMFGGVYSLLTLLTAAACETVSLLLVARMSDLRQPQL